MVAETIVFLFARARNICCATNATVLQSFSSPEATMRVQYMSPYIKYLLTWRRLPLTEETDDSGTGYEIPGSLSFSSLVGSPCRFLVVDVEKRKRRESLESRLRDFVQTGSDS